MLRNPTYEGTSQNHPYMLPNTDRQNFRIAPIINPYRIPRAPLFSEIPTQLNEQAASDATDPRLSQSSARGLSV